jgi:FkbH-like protein
VKLPSQVKLVIWDLDDTFWQGTLSEGEVSPIDENISKVKTLCQLGVMCSISSKNDYNEAKQKLTTLGVWDNFVFPSISFEPKAQHIKDIINSMQLRASDVVFIDDNHHNRAEARALLPELFVAHPNEILPSIDNLPAFNGAADFLLTRLAHYKLLESKLEDRAFSQQNNLGFLRSSEIEIHFEHDCSNNLSRIYELIERTNQLNFTKVRLADDKAKQTFMKKLEHFQYSSAVIFCRDKYGDYGAVGFYLLRTTYFGKFLEHFVFSCRAMHMGLEDYVYQHLGCPQIDVQKPTVYPLSSVADVAWITIVENFDAVNVTNQVTTNTLLLGPCNLLQTSTYLGQSVNFLHTLRNATCIRFDCPGFFLSEPQHVQNSSFLDYELVWSKGEYFAFHEQISVMQCIVLDLFDFMVCDALAHIEGVFFRPEFINKEQIKYIELSKVTIKQRLAYIKKSLELVIQSTAPDARILLLNRVFNQTTPQKERGLRLAYDRFVRSLTHPKLQLVHLNALLNKQSFDDGLHLNRSAYFSLAGIIKSGNVPEWDFDYDSYDFLDV